MCTTLNGRLIAGNAVGAPSSRRTLLGGGSNDETAQADGNLPQTQYI